MRPLRALLLVFALAPFAVDGDPYDADPDDGDSTCANESDFNGDGDSVECVLVLGPDHVLAKPGPAAYRIYQPGGAPFAHDGGTGFTQAAFPIYIATVEVSVWAEWTAGVFPLAAGGFDLVVCNDRNLDGLCTEFNLVDQLRIAESNEPQALGAACADLEKDEKDCPDPTDAEVKAFCMKPNIPANAGVGTGWNPGQVRVFIGAWLGADPFTPNVGAGLSAGIYEVWMRVDGRECTVAQCDDLRDNDGDGGVDYRDPECVAAEDTDESLPGRQ